MDHYADEPFGAARGAGSERGSAGRPFHRRRGGPLHRSPRHRAPGQGRAGGAVPPLMLQTASNPGGLPLETFDGFRASVTGDRSQYYKDLSVPFYGANRPGSKVSQGTLDMFWLWSMQVGLKAAYDCIKAFSETDQTEDLKRFDIPTLIIHGDDDQIVPIADSALLSSKLVKDATLKVYPGAPHGLMTTHKRQFNEDLLAFLRS